MNILATRVWARDALAHALLVRLRGPTLKQKGAPAPQEA